MAPLELPLELTAQEQDAAVDQCADGDQPTASVVDHRAPGVLVGLVLEEMWRTCLFAGRPDGAPGNGPGIVINDMSSGAMSGPLSLLPELTPEWPINVIDAKAPDGNGIDGDEMTWVWGQVDPSISTVVVTTPTGLYRPTMHDGYFAASWPGNNGDRTVVRGLDESGEEVAFSDQLNCAVGDPVATDQGLFTAMTPRVVVRGRFAGGGCIGGQDAAPGQSPDDIGD